MALLQASCWLPDAIGLLAWSQANAANDKQMPRSAFGAKLRSGSRCQSCGPSYVWRPRLSKIGIARASSCQDVRRRKSIRQRLLATRFDGSKISRDLYITPGSRGSGSLMALSAFLRRTLQDWRAGIDRHEGANRRCPRTGAAGLARGFSWLSAARPKDRQPAQISSFCACLPRAVALKEADVVAPAVLPSQGTDSSCRS